MSALMLWLAVGVGVYLSAAARNWDTLTKADRNSILRGLLLIPGWPVALAVIYSKRNDKE